MVHVTQRQVLVLNGSWEPIHLITVKRAMTLLAKGAAVVQEPSKHVVRTSKMAFPAPSVIRLLSYRHVPRFNRSVSRKSIFMRDGFRCQYCLKPFSANALTLDHVIPKSRGGKSDFSNLTSSCFSCNNKKGDKTPDEARMFLAVKPMPFSLHQRHKQAAEDNEIWNQYLFW